MKAEGASARDVKLRSVIPISSAPRCWAPLPRLSSDPITLPLDDAAVPCLTLPPAHHDTASVRGSKAPLSA